MAHSLPGANRTRTFLASGILLAFAWLFAPSPASAQFTNTVLPTDLIPSPIKSSDAAEESIGKDLQVRLLQKLPAPFYLTSTIESTMRIETNPFQFPSKKSILFQEVPAGSTINQLSASDQQSVVQELNESNSFDNINRINPNITMGVSPTANTQFYCNYFFLRDSLLHNSVLNSNTQSLGLGAQHSIGIGKIITLQPSYMMRELWQTGQPAVFDCLPGITLQAQFTPNSVAFVNALMQIRFRGFLGDPQRELDPFYTVGYLYQKGAWSFSSSGTFLQNFRAPFNGNALIPVNNYSFVLDFEIDRQITKKIPGLVCLVRAEPVFNFASQSTPGIAGTDFRFYYGFRLSMTKPPLSGTIQQLRQRYIREQIEKQEAPAKSQTRSKTQPQGQPEINQPQSQPQPEAPQPLQSQSQSQLLQPPGQPQS